MGLRTRHVVGQGLGRGSKYTVLPLVWCQPVVRATGTRMRGEVPVREQGRESVGRCNGVRVNERQVQDGARAEEG